MKKEDKLGDLSMQLSVDVLNMCKDLKKQGKPLFQIKSAEAQQVFVQILQRVSMLTVELILLLNFRFHLRKLPKQASGLKCFIKLNIFQKNSINI